MMTQTIYRPYAYDMAPLGTRAKHRKYTCGDYGESNDAIARMIDGVSILGTGSGFENDVGDCDDGCATTQHLRDGLEILDRAGSLQGSLKCAYDFLSQYEIVSNIGYCGDEGDERNYTEDRGVCHAFALGIPKFWFWTAVLKGVTHMLSNTHFYHLDNNTRAALQSARTTIREVVAEIDSAYPTQKRLPFMKLETTNMLLGTGTILGHANPDHDAENAQLLHSYTQMITWMQEQAQQGVAPDLMCTLMFLAPGRNVARQSNLGAFVHDPDKTENRLWYYKYMLTAATSRNYDPTHQRVWAGDVRPLAFVYSDSSGKKYGAQAQSVIMDPQQLVLVPYTFASRRETQQIKALSNASFPAYFGDTPGVGTPPLIVQRPSNAGFLSEPDVHQYLQNAGGTTPVATMFARTDMLHSREFKKQMLRVLQRGHTYDYKKITPALVDTRSLYKIQFYKTPRSGSHWSRDKAWAHSVFGSAARASGFGPSCVGWNRMPKPLRAELLRDMPVWNPQYVFVCEEWTKAYLATLAQTMADRYIEHGRMAVHPNTISFVPPLCGNWRVREILFDGNGMRALPDELFEIPTLTKLNVSRNKLRSLPAAIGTAAKLAILYVSNNRLCTLPPEMASLAHLTDLDVWRNLRTLQYLNLSKNPLHELPAAIADLGALVRLEASRMPLAALDPAITRMPSVRQLVVHHTGLQDLPAVDMRSLREAYLHHNCLKAVPDSISEAPELEQLYLQANQLSELPNTVHELPKLRTLVAANNNLMWLPDTLALCTSLTNLNVSDNPDLAHLPINLGDARMLTTLAVTDTSIAELPQSLQNIEHVMKILADESVTQPFEFLAKQHRLAEAHGHLRS
jgi:hypothetical protein